MEFAQDCSVPVPFETQVAVEVVFEGALKAVGGDGVALRGGVAGGVGGLDGDGVVAFGEGDFASEKKFSTGLTQCDGGFAIDFDQGGFVDGSFDEGDAGSSDLLELVQLIVLGVGGVEVLRFPEAVAGGVVLPGPGLEDEVLRVLDGRIGQAVGCVVVEVVGAGVVGYGALSAIKGSATHKKNHENLDCPFLRFPLVKKCRLTPTSLLIYLVTIFITL